MTKKDIAIAECAEKETEAQLTIIRALKPLDGESRRRVMEALGFLLEAEKRVGGVLEAFLRGQPHREDIKAER